MSNKEYEVPIMQNKEVLDENKGHLEMGSLYVWNPYQVVLYKLNKRKLLYNNFSRKIATIPLALR